MKLVLLMIYILHYLQDPKLWELWYSFLWVMQDLYHQPYENKLPVPNPATKKARLC